MQKRVQNLISLQFAVLLFGIAGLFGKLIPISSTQIVLGRLFFANIALLIFLLIKRADFSFKSNKDIISLFFSGAILAIHWFCFFKSIQLSSVAIGLICFSSFPLFTCILEPLIFKEKIIVRNIFLASISLVGIYFIIPEFSSQNNIFNAVVLGILSGLSFSLLAINNKLQTKKYKTEFICFYQNLFAFGILLPFVFFNEISLNFEIVAKLSVLGIVFTALAHGLYIYSLSGLKAQTVAISTNLEPVYGILAAIFILNEMPDFRSVFGGLLILATAFTINISKTKI
ncbi:MAG: DMT family transporter [Marinifilaceae bacterium]|jgi:drug/metabolite transporter (DMT)-like permease|nr:DMT family transporter [Marinifilaceae bacterium]